MAYTARKLITNAYFLSGIVARSLQTVSGQQIADGLGMLNKILAGTKYDDRFIPYFNEYVLNGVAGQEKYFIPNLVLIETFTFNIGDVRYPSIRIDRKEYFGAARVDHIGSLPFSWHPERCLGGTNLYLYFEPAGAYVLKIWGKFCFSDVDLDEDISGITEEYFINYLEHELALYICNFYLMNLPEQTGATLEQLRFKIQDVSPMDVTGVKRDRFGGYPSFNYGDINIGKGYRPIR
jgi:hypothetical protein